MACLPLGGVAWQRSSRSLKRCLLTFAQTHHIFLELNLRLGDDFIMTPRPRKASCLLFVPMKALAAFAAAPAQAGPATLSTPRFDLHFAADGRPASLKSKADGQELLAVNVPGHGFYVLPRDNVPLRFEQLKIEDGELVAACGGGLPRVTFGVHGAESYLALHIERIEALPASPQYCMHFQMELIRPVRAFELDCMTEARGGMKVAADGRHIWNRNPLDQPAVNEDNLPGWGRRLKMTRRRGVGTWVTGDSSGAILTFQIPGGDYVVPLTFTGRRSIEIPKAQAAWANGHWGWRMGGKRSYYENVNWLKLGFGLIPPRTNARVSVEGLTALSEIATELRNPVLFAGNTKWKLKGTHASGQYLSWKGGMTAAVCDANVNRIAELSVAAEGSLAPTGEFDCHISADEGPPPPWIEMQLTTRDAPLIVRD